MPWQVIAKAMGKTERESTEDPAVLIAQQIDILNKKHRVYVDNFCLKKV
jgi:hypothetical protein